jgi:FKBP-type peptidyl-prolyl cis-trans isomerase
VTEWASVQDPQGGSRQETGGRRHRGVQRPGHPLDGTEFDRFSRNGQRPTVSVAQGNQGLGEALKLIAVGSKWQVFLPPRLASGEVKGRGHRRSGTGATYSVPLMSEVEVLRDQKIP